ITDLWEDVRGRGWLGSVPFPHEVGPARRAGRGLEMRQGRRAAGGLPQLDAAPPRRAMAARLDGARAAPQPRAPIRLGESLWRGVKIFLPAAAAIFAAILAVDVGVEKYQAMRLRERAGRVAALQHPALNIPRGHIPAG